MKKRITICLLLTLSIASFSASHTELSNSTKPGSQPESRVSEMKRALKELEIDQRTIFPIPSNGSSFTKKELQESIAQLIRMEEFLYHAKTNKHQTEGEFHECEVCRNRKSRKTNSRQIIVDTLWPLYKRSLAQVRNTPNPGHD